MYLLDTMTVSAMRRADALIGATAIVHDLVMVTRNTRDFARFPLRQVDPWQAG